MGMVASRCTRRSRHFGGRVQRYAGKLAYGSQDSPQVAGFAFYKNDL